ncbi:unnamed protein product [Dibothriocephalus latus]|uniref:LIM zinc-binding domain-containing protein n=1 Tax=Dibothriocephalus latus TaxID=60516 RepID=A0A3P6SGC5_DIBLA|nr:unnamed protein product [Dibothriocephalus latus]
MASCGKCSKPIEEGKIVTAAGMRMHTDCFLCTQCKKQLVGVNFRSKNAGQYCEPCYTEKFQPKCVSTYSTKVTVSCTVCLGAAIIMSTVHGTGGDLKAINYVFCIPSLVLH